MKTYAAHQMYAGGPECPCPGVRSVYHRWFNEGRTVGMHDAQRVREALQRLVEHCEYAFESRDCTNEIEASVVAGRAALSATS